MFSLNNRIPSSDGLRNFSNSNKMLGKNYEEAERIRFCEEMPRMANEWRLMNLLILFSMQPFLHIRLGKTSFDKKNIKSSNQ